MALPEIGSVLDGAIEHITNFGAFVQLDGGQKGLVHISEVSQNYVKDISTLYKVGDKVKVKVIKVEPDGKIGLSIKRAQEEFKSHGNPNNKNQEHFSPKTPEDAFEDMLAKFKKSSEERMLDIKRNRENKCGSYSRRR